VANAVKAQRLAKVCKLPLIRSGRIRAPWSPSSCTRLPHPSGWLIAEIPLWSHRFGASFPNFHWFPTRRFNLTVRHIDVILTTLLSIALRRCRPTASSVCMLPLFQRRNSTSWSPLTRARFLDWAHADSHRHAFSPECCELFLERLPSPTCRLSPRGSQGQSRPESTHFAAFCAAH